MMNNLTFSHPYFFLLFLVLPLIGWWYMRRYKNHYAPITMSDLSGFSSYNSWRGRLRALLPVFRALTAVLLIFALARPQRLLKQEDIKAEGIDIMLAMDLSSSMLSQDFEPDRLEVTKGVASSFVRKREFDRIGLVTFSGEAFPNCPLTTDHKVVLELLHHLKCGILKPGTAIGMGLASAVNKIKDSPAKSKIVILMTDGVNNAGYFKPDMATGIAKTLGIKVYCIGVGSKGEAMSPVDERDGHYVYALTPVEIDEELLENISKETGGKYYRATNGKELDEIYSEIDKLEKSKIDVTTIKRRSEEFGGVLLGALFLIFLELGLRYTVFRTIP
jgi:Ca-activated chloride channel homolog